MCGVETYVRGLWSTAVQTSKNTRNVEFNIKFSLIRQSYLCFKVIIVSITVLLSENLIILGLRES